jgi:hypothetical protein
MSITSYDHHPTLRHEERDALGTALQAVLIDLIDLSLVAKQLHWNVTGPTSAVQRYACEHRRTSAIECVNA